MTDSTPHSKEPTRTVHPTADVADPTMTDLVPGDPPVPITVWRTARTDTDTCRLIPARLAARLVAAYTRPGEIVVDVTADHSLASACRTGRRRHHPARFTTTGDLLIGPPTPNGDTETDSADPSIWSADDLGDADPPTGAPTGAAAGTPHQVATALVVAGWPLHRTDSTHRVRLARLLAGGADLLRPGGCLILIIDARPAPAAPQDFSPVVSAAASVGLGYLQHIVAVTADTDGDAFVYYLDDEELLTLTHQRKVGRQPVNHLRVHADLVVFGKGQDDSSGHGRTGRQGGGRRG